jgi:hypothetical protein
MAYFAGLIGGSAYVQRLSALLPNGLRLALLLGCLLGFGAGLTVVAQEATVGLSPGLNAALVRLFGEHKAFTAQLRIRMTDGQGIETLSAALRFALSDGKMRGDLDVTKLKSKDLPALAASAAKSVGMEKVVTLVRPDKAETYLLYPAFQSCLVAPIDASDLAALKQPAKIQRTPVAHETLDGHPCVKSKVIVTESDGQPHESIVWYAKDLKDFPLRIRTVDGADTLDLHFSQIRFVRPEAKEFDLPAGTARYDDVQDLTAAVMKKMLKDALGGQ